MPTEEKRSSKSLGPDKIRVSLDVKKDFRDKLDALMAQHEVPSYAELFRRALSLMEMVYHNREEGGKLIFEHPNGTKEHVRIL